MQVISITGYYGVKRGVFRPYQSQRMKNPARERAFRIGYRMSQNTGGDEGIVTLCFTTLPHSLTLTGILTSAFRLRFEPLNHGFESHDPQHKNKTPERAFNFCGGDEGIRTLDTLASIPHFQCGALDQLCDVSGFF